MRAVVPQASLPGLFERVSLLLLHSSFQFKQGFLLRWASSISQGIVSLVGGRAEVEEKGQRISSLEIIQAFDDIVVFHC